jgi:hypothetical protein
VLALLEQAAGRHQLPIALGTGQNLGEAVGDRGGRGFELGEDGQDRGAHRAVRALLSGAATETGRAFGELVQVDTFARTQPQRLGERGQHLGGGMAVTTLLEPDQVFDTDPRKVVLMLSSWEN